MAVYEYYCAVCEETFEKLVPMSEVKASVACPVGHEGAKRKLSVVASVGKGDGIEMGGACCGGACGCGS
jgi:putative FmdB family regulatory protein